MVLDKFVVAPGRADPGGVRPLVRGLCGPLGGVGSGMDVGEVGEFGAGLRDRGDLQATGEEERLRLDAPPLAGKPGALRGIRHAAHDLALDGVGPRRARPDLGGEGGDAAVGRAARLRQALPRRVVAQ